MLRDRLVVTHHMVRLCWGGPLPAGSAQPAQPATSRPEHVIFATLWRLIVTPFLSELLRLPSRAAPGRARPRRRLPSGRCVICPYEKFSCAGSHRGSRGPELSK